MRHYYAFLLSGAFFAMPLTGCGTDGAGGGADAATGDSDASGSCGSTAAAWTAPAFETNAAEVLALRAQLDMLTGTTMRGAEQETLVVDEVADLELIYDGGDPVLSATAHGSFDTVVYDAFSEFVPAVLSGPQDLFDDEEGGWTPGDNGGIYGARQAAINAGGIELRQIVDKGLFGGGALYAHALALTEGTITEATIDAIAAAWGTDAALDPEARTDSAKYTFAMGFHAQMAQAITEAKAYVADANCAAELDEALQTYFQTWEQVLFARLVFYANAGAAGMASATTDDERADALHELSEGLGLAIGFHGLPHPSSGPMAGAGRVVADADIEAMMTALGVDLDDLAASTTGEFTQDSSAFQDGVTAVEDRVKQVYQLDDSDIASYRSPTEG